MTKLWGSVAAAAMLLATAAPAGAQAFNGAAKIARGDYAAAERDIVAQRGLQPDDVDLMLNLAAVYMATGRVGDARRLYGNVAAQPDQEVLLNSGASAWSHALAAAAMTRMPTVTAAR